jgi:outer membrane cobalamin receptor
MLSSRVSLINPLVVLSMLLSTGACGTLRPGITREGHASGRTITAEQIARSGATNAWEALRRSGTHLLVRENTRSEQARISHRGANSLLLSNEVLVVVDGIHLTDWTYLREIPAASIAYIRIMSGPQGTVQYGTPAGNGVIVVSTAVPNLRGI